MTIRGPLFEATFRHEGVLVRVDIMERAAQGGWHMAEVKSSTGARDYHHGDLATQNWVLEGCGIDVRLPRSGMSTVIPCFADPKNTPDF